MAFKYPWTNLHELNLDWVLGQISQLSKQIAKVTGLTATAHSLPGASDPTVDVTGGTGDTPYNFDFGIPAGGGGGAVDSVNGQTGDVVLDKDDVGLSNVANVAQYSASNPPPYPVTSVNGQTGAVVVSGGAVDSVNGQTGTVVLDKDDIGLSSVDNVRQYSASNPPPYPVTSVNGMTGDVIVSGGGGGSGDVLSVNGKSGVVVLDKTDIGLGNVDNVQQYSATNPPPYPVGSVNGQTGDVVLDKDDIGLSNVANVVQYSASNPPPYPVTSVNGMTGDVVVSGGGSSGAKQTANIISLYPNDITVQSAYKVVIGDLISYIVKFRNSKSANLNYGVLSGFDKPMTTGSGQGAGVILVNTDGHIYHAVISASGGGMDIPSNAGIPLGDYTATTTYIKQ